MPLLVNIYCSPPPRHLDTNTRDSNTKVSLLENLFEVESLVVHKYVKVSIKVNGMPPKRMEYPNLSKLSQ